MVPDPTGIREDKASTQEPVPLEDMRHLALGEEEGSGEVPHECGDMSAPEANSAGGLEQDPTDSRTLQGTAPGGAGGQG